MQLSETLKLYLTKEQVSLIDKTMRLYIVTVNALVDDAVHGRDISRLTSKDVKQFDLPATLLGQSIRDAQSVFKKYSKRKKEADLENAEKLALGKEDLIVPKVPILKKPCCYVNNQNFKIKEDHLEFPVRIDGKTQRISVKTEITDRQKNLFKDAKLGTLRIVTKNNRIVAQVVYEKPEQSPKEDGNVMGVDLGIKCPAVSKCSDGSVKFYGNGRKNRVIRRHFATKRTKLQKSKNLKAVKRINDKEQRIMKDIDHKISREIVNTAIEHNVKTIKIEKMSGINSTTRRSRKNNRLLHGWSFYRLSSFIEYKAKLAGIEVRYVKPENTSQTCPICGKQHHARDRKFVCECGYRGHRDIVGAWNICRSTEYVGGSDTRRTARETISPVPGRLMAQP